MNTPNAAAVSNINEGLTLLTKRLSPAKLKVEGPEGKRNGFYFNTWAMRQGLALSTMTAQAIADEFYKAVQHDVVQPVPTLIWTTPPKTLLARVQAKGPKTHQDVRPVAGDYDTSAADKANAAINAQEAAKKRCYGVVDRFTPVRRGGVRAYAIQETKQKEWRAKIAKTTDFVTLESIIRAESEEIYAQLERAAQV
jgi:hypothetical protein